jgi:hypothetical protein
MRSARAAPELERALFDRRESRFERGGPAPVEGAAAEGLDPRLRG